MKALLVIDMQVAMLDRSPRDVEGVVRRINEVARAVRDAGGLIVFIQHEGPPEDEFSPGKPGWEILPELQRAASDEVVAKKVCDGFCETRLDQLLKLNQVSELYVCGWATDYCVDTTVRAAASLGYDIIIVGDGHTVVDRSHLDAKSIIQHHNATWAGMDVPGKQMRVEPASAIIESLR